MTTFWASVFVFAILIFFHELGHFAVAKAVGIKVHEFSLGFGPKLFCQNHKGTDYNVRLLPLGGYVRMAGMDPEEENVEEGKGFNDKTVLQRVAVITAGPLMNFFLAALLMAIIFILQGVPVSGTTVAGVLPGQPAEQAGIRSGDQIYSIAGKKVADWEEIISAISSRPGQSTDLVIIRDNEKISLTVTPVIDEEGRALIGISRVQKLNPLAALGNGFKFTFQVTVLILDFVGKMIIGQEPADLGGPVRMVWEIDRAVNTGFYYLLQLAAFLSINLGLFNLFPIPALDGSRIMFLGLESLRGRPVDPSKENFIHMVGFGLLLLLVVFVTYNDILQLFTKSLQGSP